LKIVIDARELRTSTGRYMERLLHYLQLLDDGHEYVVLLKPADMDGWKPTNPRFRKVACMYKEFTFGEQIGFKRQLEELKPDLVHFGMTQQPVFYRGKTVTTVHDLTTIRFRNPAKNWLVFALKQQIYKWVIKRVAAKSTHLITPTEFVKNDVMEFTGVNPGKITVTHEAADKITAPPEPVGGLAQASFIMYVGRPTPHKNLDRLVRAFSAAQKTHQDLHLVLVGKTDDNYRRLQAATEQQGIKNVLFTGFVPEGQLRWLYEHARAYVFPSLSEGFGLPGLEAMAHGCPLLSSSATCLPEVYQNAALYFDPADVDDIADKIAALLDNPQLAQKLTAEGYNLQNNYSWQRMAEQTLEIYQQVLD